MILLAIAVVVVAALTVGFLVFDAQRRAAETGLVAAQQAEQEAIDAAVAAQKKAEAEAERKRLAEEKAAAEKAAREKAIGDPASITVVINKKRPFDPIDWAPDDLVTPNIPVRNGQQLRTEAARAIEKMYAAASADGASFVLGSGYRSYSRQVQLFESYVQRDGVEAAETYSARPGHSEHQTGLVADIDDNGGCYLETCFGDTAAGTWVREHGHEYGFIVRYERDQQAVVGYIYEPWHLRYVGVEVATAMHDRGIANLEDYFELPAAPDY